MRVVLNILWLVFGGLILALGYALAGIVMFVLIITIPFGVAAFRLAGYTLWPFGRTVVAKPGSGVGSFLLNVIWFVLAGLWLAIGHLLAGIILCITIIGIPLGLAHFKLIPVCVAPLGKQIVPSGTSTPMATV
ncbi:MAG: YccF domain-containing protein [Acidimicrobiales bacterium]